MIDKEKLILEIDSRFLSRIEFDEDNIWKINVYDLYYKDLNNLLRSMNDGGATRIELFNVFGQRYIGTDLAAKMEIDIYGTPGNDLGAFMNGPKITVHGNTQDGCCNTMNNGLVIIHGHAGDITGYSMREGKTFIRDNVGYRAGIHMKEFQGKRPYLVVGGTAQNFLGEYMAGGVIVVLGMNLKDGKRHNARFVGTGMHGGVIYIRGKVDHIGKEVEYSEITKEDDRLLRSLVYEFCDYFKFDSEKIINQEFSKLTPISYRPYEKIYAY